MKERHPTTPTQPGGSRADCQSPSRTARRAVILLGLLTLALGLANLARVGTALWYDTRLPDLATTAPLPYLAAMGIGWGALWVGASVGLMRRRPWGRRATLVLVTLYETHVWINHSLFDANEYAWQTQPRDMALSLLLLTIVWGTLSLPRVREVFQP